MAVTVDGIWIGNQIYWTPRFTQLVTHQEDSLHAAPQEDSLSPQLTLSKSKLYYNRQSVGQSVLVSGTHLGPAINFSPSLFDYF
jgi:hypothetical protein